MNTLPEWMRPQEQTERWTNSPMQMSSRRGRSVIRRAADGFGRMMADMLENESTAAVPGLLQVFEARAKVIGLISLLVVVTLIHGFDTLLLCYGVCILLAAASRVPTRKILRVWGLAPLFSAAIALPAILNVVTPGNPVLILWNGGTRSLGPWQMPSSLTVTDAGLVVAGRFVLRTAVCISIALLLTSTTSAAKLFRGLRALGVPRIFVMLLNMMQRYLGVIARAAEEIHLAKISRSIVVSSGKEERSWIAAGMGSLFRRTQSLGQSVYLAMISRGYTGEVHLLDEPRWRRRDWAFLFAVAAFESILLILG